MPLRRTALLSSLVAVGLGLPAVAPHPAGAAAPVPAVSAPQPADEIVGFGDTTSLGSLRNVPLAKPVVAAASTPSANGYWLFATDGGVFSFGDAAFHGSTGGIVLNRPIVGASSTASGGGYWMVAGDGGIFSFGDAAFFGSTGAIVLNQPIVAMATTPTGKGYWLVARDGGIFTFGDAGFFGSTGAVRLNQPIVGMSSTASGRGYWLVASDGGIFSFGDAAFHGSTGAVKLNKPITAMARTPSGHGYWMVATDGGVFPFGDAGFHGAGPQIPMTGTVIALLPSASGNGYRLVAKRRFPPLAGAPTAWLAVDLGKHATLYEQASDQRRRPASTTKMLTALVAVSSLPANATVPISQRAADVEDGVIAKAGEVWSLEDALYGLLLPSGNDIAYALAERVSGSVEAFQSAMLAEAGQLGLTDSTWKDPAGLDDEFSVGGGNWTSARDLQRLAEALLADPLLARIVRTQTHTFAGPYGTPHTVENTNKLLKDDPSVAGIKTGTTNAAGQCLVAIATRNGRTVLTVILGAKDRYDATEALLGATPPPVP